jgi:SAM-dependent methyltransferase
MRISPLVFLFPVLAFSISGSAQPTPPPIAPPPAETAPDPVQILNHEAAALSPLAASGLARAFLNGTAALPIPTARTLLRTKDRSACYTPEQAAALSQSVRSTLTEKTYPPSFYYTTGYGSPLVYARVLDLLAEHGVSSVAGKKLLDFGYGTIGHIRLLASLGCDAHGVDVEPVFQALYAQPQDQGEVPGINGAHPGRITLHGGRWPAERSIVRDVGNRYDIITSKNTLKRGYIHPARPADPRTLVHLGVDDGTFLRNVYDALNPGGVFLIYNLSPAQAPSDKPYIPWADGQCPFPRELLERSGFQVIEFDHEDREPALDYWMALGFNQGKSREETAKDLFVWYTLCRKPATGSSNQPK